MSDDANDRLLEKIYEDLLDEGFSPEEAAKKAKEMFEKMADPMATGGRAGFQTGGITESRTLPPEYVEALGKTYAADLTRQAGMPTVTTATTQQPGETAQQFAQRQAQIRANEQAAAALGTPGAFGGGREGVQRAEYQASSDRNRAQTLAGLRQSGFQQAASRRQQDLANQMGIANLQQGLGGASQDFSRAQISGLGTLGAAQQSQNQAILNAQQQAAQMAIDEPRQALDRFGQGIAGITPGAGATRLTDQPAAAQSSPLMQALGIGLAGADIYGRIF